MRDFSNRMAGIYASMQDAYESVARHYGFSCGGCTDNCCTQRFFHYTYAEHLYLLEGVRQAGPALVRRIMARAKDIVATYESEREAGVINYTMCPANEDGLCTLHAHRPLICRMHGLPHRFRTQDGREERGGGCSRFADDNPRTTWTVNRTSHYNALAKLEGELRSAMRLPGGFKRTTAELLVEMHDTDAAVRDICG